MATDIRSGIIETARALGMDPVELATIISYESGFNPEVWGGKGGQHYGLIQFGPTERQQYGVAVGDPASQLGANGAIARYFWDRGWKPGMSFMDAYSIVNAGSPGRFNASDTAAGGQPGTVRDKVENQMSGHRQKAAALVGQAGPNTRAPYGPLEAAGGGDRPDRFTARPGGPVEAAGGGAGSDPGQYAPPTATSPYAALVAAADTEKKKNPWEVFGEGIGDAAGAMGKAQFGYNVPAGPGAARVDVGGGPMIDPQAAEMRRQQLAYAMQRLNQGVLF